MKKKIILKIVVGLLLGTFVVLLMGCDAIKIDPLTGTRYLDPCDGTYILIRGIAETAEPIVRSAGAAVSLWHPLTGALLSLVGIVFGLIKRKQAINSHTTTTLVVKALEEWKKLPKVSQTWEKLKEILTEFIGPDAENAIRAIRGLPEKQPDKH